MIGAQAMVKCLEAEGVKAVFGYPGVAIAPFYNAMLESDVDSVLVRTEQNAGHAASGYYRVSGQVGVCAVTSGPGATNLITGIATAFADSIPMVAITGQVKSDLIGSDVFQEADITGAVESFVKYSYLIKDVEDIPRVFKEAFYIATTGRKGPVLIDVPIDIQNATLKKFNYPKEVSLRTYKPTVKGHIMQIKKLSKALERAKRPIVCAGGGVLLSDASKELAAFVEKFNIPMVHTMMGKGALRSDHRLNYGMVGNNGKPYANRAMNDSDLLIMIGARVADRAISQPDLVMENKILIHVDVDPAEIGKNVESTIPIVGDAKTILSDILEQEINCNHQEWVDELENIRANSKPTRKPKPEFVDPAEFIKILTEEMSEDGIYVADVGQNQMWSAANAIVKSGKFLTTGGMGTMGYSIPAAMGARKILGKGTDIVAVCGDGSFQMSFMELATINQHDLPVKIIILKNGYLGMVREYQHYNYNDKYSVVDLSGSPDVEKLSAAYGIDFIRLYDMSDVRNKIKEFLNKPGSGLMECVIDPEDLVKY